MNVHQNLTTQLLLQVRIERKMRTQPVVSTSLVPKQPFPSLTEAHNPFNPNPSHPTHTPPPQPPAASSASAPPSPATSPPPPPPPPSHSSQTTTPSPPAPPPPPHPPQNVPQTWHACAPQPTRPPHHRHRRSRRRTHRARRRAVQDSINQTVSCGVRGNLQGKEREEFFTASMPATPAIPSMFPTAFRVPISAMTTNRGDGHPVATTICSACSCGGE